MKKVKYETNIVFFLFYGAIFLAHGLGLMLGGMIPDVQEGWWIFMALGFGLLIYGVYDYGKRKR